MDNNNNQLESPSSHSDCSTPGYAEDELMLASHTPKKRAGRIKFKETRHPVYRGIRLRNSGKWVCEVREPNSKTRVWLGTYPTAEMAARAHDVAALAMRGRSACLNFADSVWRLPVPQSNNVKDIQIAAAKAAEAFGQKENTVKETNLNPSEHISTEIFYEPYLVDMSSTKHEIYQGQGDGTNNTEVVVYDDEEEMFGMPNYIASMAEGLMVAPPQTMEYANSVENVDFCVDYSLWSF